MKFQYKSLAVTSLFHRLTYRLLLSAIVLTVVLVSSLYAQPSYRNKQDQLLGQSNRNRDSNSPQNERPKLNLRDPESIKNYTGKDPYNQPVQSSAVEDTVAAIRKGFSKSRSADNPSYGYGAAILAVVLLATLVVGFVLYKYYNPLIANLHLRTGYDNPRDLFNKLCEAHDIDQKNQVLIKSVAERLGVTNVLLLFIEPQFLQQALDKPAFLADRRQIQNLQQVLFGEYGEDVEDTTNQSRSKLRVEMSRKELPGQSSVIQDTTTIVYPSPQPKKQEPPKKEPPKQEPNKEQKPTLFQTLTLNTFTETVTNLVKLLHNKLTTRPTKPDKLTYRPERTSIPIEETNLTQLFYEPLPDGSKLEKLIGR